MSGLDLGRRRLTLTALAIVCLFAHPASGDKYFGAAGGAMVPYSGGTGWTALIEFGTDWTNEHVRVGGELVFSDIDEQLNLTALGAGVVPIDMRTYEARFATRYVMFPGKITPYIGVGAGLIVVHLDDQQISGLAMLPGIVRTNSKLGFGGGVDGVIGLEIPMFSTELNLFGEARAKYSWEFTNNLAPVASPENWNGFSGVMGLRARF